MAPAASYRADIVAFMHTYLNNPVGVRDAFISEPALRTVEGASRNSVCLRYTARKSDGQYAPSKDSLVIFRQGRLDRVVDNAPRGVQGRRLPAVPRAGAHDALARRQTWMSWRTAAASAVNVAGYGRPQPLQP